MEDLFLRKPLVEVTDPKAKPIFLTSKSKTVRPLTAKWSDLSSQKKIMENQDFQKRYEDLKQQGLRLERGSVEKVDLFEKAVNLTDLLKDEKLQIESRNNYIDAAIDARYPEKAMTAYSFLLRKYDEKPDLFGWFEKLELLWKYKWVIGYLSDFPSIPKAKIVAALEDMEVRYLAENNGQEAVYHYYYSQHGAMGDFETGDFYYEKCKKESRREMSSDCEACCISSEVYYFVKKGEYEKAIELGEPILSGKKSCRTIPNQFYHHLLIPFWLTGQKEEALKYAAKIETKPALEYLAIHGELINVKVLAGELTAALEIFENNLIFAIESLGKNKPFFFYLSAKLLFKKLIAAGHETVKMTLPSAIPFAQANNEYATEEVLAWLIKEITALETQFNARNGNDFYSKLVEKGELLETK